MDFKYTLLRHAFPLTAAWLTMGWVLLACSDKDINTADSEGKALVTFSVSEKQDEAQASVNAGQPMTRAAFAHQLAQQDLTPEDLVSQKLPVQGKASAGICLIESTLPGVPSQRETTAPTRANITDLSTLGNFSTTAFYGSSDTSLEPWFYDKDTRPAGTLVTPIYWDWIKNHGCFYAVYPKPYSKLQLSPSSYTGTPYVNIEVEPDVRNQKDLMTACSGIVHTTIGAMNATAPRTDLTFRHAMTAVRFKVGQNLSYSRHITKVEIVNAKSKGKYILPNDINHTGVWDAASISTPTTFTLGGDGTVDVSTTAAVGNIIMGDNGDNYVFYMIPQSLTGVQVKIYFDGNNTTPAITADLRGQWKPGMTKTYSLSQNTSDWRYQIDVESPTDAEYSATATGNYKIQSYRKDPTSGTLQAVPWEVVGYDTDGDGTFSMSEPLPSWFTGLTVTNGNGSITPAGETGVANLVPVSATEDKLAALNAALKQNPKGSASDYYDLSTHDIKGNVTPRNTANCYIISHPGFYKIPLVYGNAIQNGAPNSKAYTYKGNLSDPNIAYVLQHFKDHDNQDITDPWIERTNTWTNNGVNDAKVVWADEAGLVQFGATKIVHDANYNAFVQFEVPTANIKNGNAVIAVMKNGTVVWSWHLWFTHEDALNTITCTNYQDKNYRFTEETLGWKYTTWIGTNYISPRSIKVKVRQTKGQIDPATRAEGIVTITQKPGSVSQLGTTTLYQWGRKDAFPGTDDNLVGTFNRDAGDNMSISNGIQHPENFYTRGSSWENNPPTGYAWYNLWASNNTVTGHNDNYVVKTIYDPCPVGFKVPASNAFTGFVSGGVDGGDPNGTWHDGWYFNNKLTNPTTTIFFPTSGSRSLVDGVFYTLNNECVYWTAIPDATPNSCALDLSEYVVYPLSFLYRSYGYSVRPVADLKTSVKLKMPGSTEDVWEGDKEVDAGEIEF